ncbi:hypothetical protein CHUAL_011289 [Chamberlinius hualienensis]
MQQGKVLVLFAGILTFIVVRLLFYVIMRIIRWQTLSNRAISNQVLIRESTPLVNSTQPFVLVEITPVSFVNVVYLNMEKIPQKCAAAA